MSYVNSPLDVRTLSQMDDPKIGCKIAIVERKWIIHLNKYPLELKIHQNALLVAHSMWN